MKRMLKDTFLGFLIGGTMSVPGISGGTVALCLGCYGTILSAAANLKKRESLRYLFRIGFGGILGFFWAAKLLNLAFTVFPVMMSLIFCVAAGTGIFLLGKEALESGVTAKGIFLFLLGFGTVLLVEKFPSFSGETAPILAVVWGIFLAAGVILPGISTSHLLLVFGLYDDVAKLSGFSDVIPLLPLGFGTVLGMILLAKPLAAALEKHPSHCRFLLMGFAVGSLKALWEPCLENPQTEHLLWVQIGIGLILSAGVAWGVILLNRKERGENLKKL